MRPRPTDFFGPEDWTGGDPEDDIKTIRAAQKKWDEEYQQLPWWRRLLGLW